MTNRKEMDKTYAASRCSCGALSVGEADYWQASLLLIVILPEENSRHLFRSLQKRAGEIFQIYPLLISKLL
ncbi:hypothetical protein, partial [Methylomonas koyamae]|uniref:hypothetical protein n=2 Tax=Methylomonas TaxID=416 RepID=UPI000A931A62